MTSKASPFDPARRQFLGGMVAGAGLALLGSRAWASGLDSPFSLGVASGDPLPDGFVIWTRLAPVGAGGLEVPLPSAVPVRWTVASDENMRQVVKRGEVIAEPGGAHSVHVEVAGLQPGRPYWYRFEAAGELSSVGRAHTAPSSRSLAPARFGFVSCSHYELGHFSAYRHLAAEQPDLVFFLGDYIYEYSLAPGSAKLLRAHDLPEATDLAGYRRRYAQYKRDPDLQLLHSTAPCVVTWDDHEVQNDYANRWSQDAGVDPQAFLRRRAAAYQAFYEHMPLRRSHAPRGPNMRLYRRLDYGRLARFHVLDGRQYRSEQPCIPASGSHRGHVASADCRDLQDPARSMLGWEQEAWVHQGLAQSTALWNVFAQDLLVSPLLQRDPASGGLGHWTDGWDGYAATRQRLLAAIEHTRARNPVFWGGDIHSFWATDLYLGDKVGDGKVVATEFVTSSVTSDGPPFEAFNALLPLNPQVKFFDSRPRGYVSVTLDDQVMDVRFQAISERRDPAATLATLKRFQVEAGRPGVRVL
ncbi:alkaline phosphatase D family protein [Pseudomonas massiliensis]|uniref:alkaline phosphatase D family protein n=1 Tax=Pseudomonas massiliensis TaxID=522492 RepID=UPI00058D502B|nr:alkaline phosphatase D family protein [Pseudomonas massiliensis]